MEERRAIYKHCKMIALLRIVGLRNGMACEGYRLPLTFNQWVTGSNPVGRTNSFKDLSMLSLPKGSESMVLMEYCYSARDFGNAINEAGSNRDRFVKH